MSAPEKRKRVRRPSSRFPLLLTFRQAADYLGLSDQTICNVRSVDPEFPAARIVPSLIEKRYLRDDVRDYARRLRKATFKDKRGE